MTNIKKRLMHFFKRLAFWVSGIILIGVGTDICSQNPFISVYFLLGAASFLSGAILLVNSIRNAGNKGGSLLVYIIVFSVMYLFASWLSPEDAFSGKSGTVFTWAILALNMWILWIEAGKDVAAAETKGLVNA